MANTKLCKFCNTEIAKNAKICPNCMGKQRTSKLPIILIVLVVIAIIGIGASQGDNTPKKVNSEDKNETNNDNNDSKEPEAFKIGEIVELKDVRATLVSVTESTGNDWFKPDEGKIFLICEFNIENNSTDDISVSTLLSFEAYCDDYSVNLSISGITSSGKTQLDGSVAAGKKMNGVIAYEVASDWKSFEINFSPSVWGKAIKFIANKN